MPHFMPDKKFKVEFTDSAIEVFENVIELHEECKCYNIVKEKYEIHIPFDQIKYIHEIIEEHVYTNPEVRNDLSRYQ